MPAQNVVVPDRCSFLYGLEDQIFGVIRHERCWRTDPGVVMAGWLKAEISLQIM